MISDREYFFIATTPTSVLIIITGLGKMKNIFLAFGLSIGEKEKHETIFWKYTDNKNSIDRAQQATNSFDKF